MVVKEWTKRASMAGYLVCLGLVGVMSMVPGVAAAEAWELQEHPSLDLLYVNTDEPAIRYREVYLDPVSVWYPGQSQQPSEQVELLQQRTLDFFRAALTARGLSVTGEPNASTLIIHVELIDLREAVVTTELLELASAHRFRMQPGLMTLVAELRSAATGRVLVRVADLQDRGQGPESLFSDAEAALADWSEAIAAGIASPQQDATLAHLRR